MILDWHNPTPEKFQHTQRPCATCQYFERQIAYAYQLKDEPREVELRQDYQRHKALNHPGGEE